MSFLNKHNDGNKDDAQGLFKAGKNASLTPEEKQRQLQNKPFSQWTKRDIAMYRDIQIEVCQEDVDDGLIEDFELEDLINCWAFEIVDDALIRTRTAPPCEEMMLGLMKPTTDLVVGYCQIDGIDSLAAADTRDPMEQTRRQQRKVELQQQLHRERNVPGQELETIPRPAHMS
ncbi:hypothetical protein EU712_26045 [Escherichia coli]|uniref:hypothetical protein n=1 Tax=Escherichia coli TaxID=562 RepID=UPI0013DE58D4|nr:hypothetical protein [Escherichia coli]EEY5898032.1 hypothetical protein [Escherichia coli]EFD8929101.1 hypothetical protein [Escherichia coli]EFF0248834.1 hypothetical protein [Escherichia coli]EFO3028927.1 hypothetical protein [Escherichia coli]QIF16411.1 hypothetical protein G6Z99_26310 [Escherichia coli]